MAVFKRNVEKLSQKTKTQARIKSRKQMNSVVCQKCAIAVKLTMLEWHKTFHTHKNHFSLVHSLNVSDTFEQQQQQSVFSRFTWKREKVNGLSWILSFARQSRRAWSKQLCRLATHKTKAMTRQNRNADAVHTQRTVSLALMFVLIHFKRKL